MAKQSSYKGDLKLPALLLTKCIYLFWREGDFIICFHKGTI